MLLRNILLITFFLLMVTVFPILAKATPDFSGCNINITNSGTTYTINQNNTVYCLNENINLDGLNGVNFSAGVQNTTLDCLGYNIDSNYSLGPYGVYLDGSSTSNNTIKNCNITDFFFGINLELSSNNTIINNTANYNWYGIYLNSSSNNTIVNNIANNNIFGGGILLYSSPNNTIVNNTITNNSAGIYIKSSPNNNLINNTINNSIVGFYIDSSPNNTLTNNTIQVTHNSSSIQQGLEVTGYSVSDFINNINSGNTINGLPIYYIDSINRPCTNNAVYTNGSSYSYMGFVNCNNITVSDSSPTDSVVFVGLTNSSINNINMSYSFSSLYFFNTSFSNITNCIVNNNWYGIFLSHSNNNTLTNNTANNNNIVYGGISLYNNSNNNTLTNNTANSNWYGIYILNSSSNNIKGGSVWNNTYDYYLDYSGSINSFNNTNFTSSRSIYFNDVDSWFNYANGTSGLLLQTNNINANTLTRTLNSWSTTNISWNESDNYYPDTANYTIYGLTANTLYAVSNNSVNRYIINSSSCGCINFTIDLTYSSQTIQVTNDTTPTAWSGNYSFIASNYSTSTFDSFYINWTDSVGISKVFITIINATGGNVLVNNSSMVYDAIYGLTYGANYNYSINLPPGTYNWTSYANDTSGNWNSTPTWMMEGTKGKGTPTLTLSIDGAEAGKSVTYGTTTTVVATESNSEDSDVNYTFYRGTSAVTSPDTSTLSEGTYVYVYNSTGGTNWSSANISRTLNVTAATFTPSSPGSSGPASTPSTKVTAKKGEANITIPSIEGGKSTNVTIAKTEDVAVRQINISVSNPVNNIKIIITKLPGSPASVTHIIEGKVYHYIQIDKSNITDSDLNKAYIKFAINKTWLTINGVDKTNMALYRWANDKWNELATTYVSEDSLEVFYQAETPGFSYFLIGTKGGEVTTQAPTGEAITCTESWSCTDWSACNNSQQTRTCTDTNNCGTIAIKPEESQTCQIDSLETTTQTFPMFEVSLIIIVAIVIVIFVILELTGKIHLSNIRKSIPSRMKTENSSKPPENVKYYYTKKDMEEAEKDKDKKENK